MRSSGGHRSQQCVWQHVETVCVGSCAGSLLPDAGNAVRAVRKRRNRGMAGNTERVDRVERGERHVAGRACRQPHILLGAAPSDARRETRRDWRERFPGPPGRTTFTVRLEVGPGQNLKHGSHAETCWMRPRENKHTKRDPVSACQDQGMGSKHCGLLRMESSACTSESRRYPSQSRSEHSKSRDCVKNFKECCWWRWQRARTMRSGCM